MPAQSPQHRAASDALSALADGQASAQELDQILVRWATDADTRQAWSDHHVVGEVMRSSEIVSVTPPDVFLNKLRGRLAQEPVVFAPVAAQATASKAVVRFQRRTWLGPTAVAAGFVMVVGAMVSVLAPQATVPAGSMAFAEQHIELGAPEADQALGVAAVPVATAMVSAQALAPVAGAGLAVRADEAPSFSHPAQFRHMLITDTHLDQALNLRRNARISNESFATQHVGVYTVSLSTP